jgi:hypothetical protein
VTYRIAFPAVFRLGGWSIDTNNEVTHLAEPVDIFKYRTSHSMALCGPHDVLVTSRTWRRTTDPKLDVVTCEACLTAAKRFLETASKTP